MCEPPPVYVVLSIFRCIFGSRGQVAESYASRKTHSCRPHIHPPRPSHVPFAKLLVKSGKPGRWPSLIPTYESFDEHDQIYRSEDVIRE